MKNENVKLEDIFTDKIIVNNLLDFSIEGKYIIDVSGDCIYVNKSCLEILNYTNENDLLSKDIHSLIHHTKKDGSHFHKNDCPVCKVLIKKKRIYVDNEIMWRMDGTNFPVEYWSSPIKKDGKILGAIVSIYDMTTRKQNERLLEEAHSKLSFKQEALEKSNIALNEILHRIEAEKNENMLYVQSHINRIIMPIVRGIEKRANIDQAGYITLLKENLLEITSPFIGKLENQFTQLSPREVEICKFVKDGMSSKEIAMHLNLSQETIRNHRKNIRKKLNINNKQINLSSYLKTM